MERRFANEFLAKGYRAGLAGTDLVSPDGREAYEIKFGGRGVRDLRDAVLRLATFIARDSRIERGYVLASLVRVSPPRLLAEWKLINQVLLPQLAERIRLVAITDGNKVIDPPSGPTTPVVDRFLEFVRTAHARSVFSPSASGELPVRPRPATGTTWKHLEVEKVLLHRWLLGMEPVSIGTLASQVGCSYPTAMQAVHRLSASELITRGRSRGVALRQYPRDRWAELFRIQGLIYPPQEFVDPTAEPGAADGILQRLYRVRPPGAALGGVVAARRWDPSFDLNGTPRIDLLLHAPEDRALGGADRVHDATHVVRRLDPALKRKSPDVQGATVLAIHQTHRHDPLFLDELPSPMPWSSPVEVLCHLNHLGLTAQAGELLRRLRQDVTA